MKNKIYNYITDSKWVFEEFKVNFHLIPASDSLPTDHLIHVEQNCQHHSKTGSSNLIGWLRNFTIPLRFTSPPGNKDMFGRCWVNTMSAFAEEMTGFAWMWCQVYAIQSLENILKSFVWSTQWKINQILTSRTVYCALYIFNGHKFQSPKTYLVSLKFFVQQFADLQCGIIFWMNEFLSIIVPSMVSISDKATSKKHEKTK